MLGEVGLVVNYGWVKIVGECVCLILRVLTFSVCIRVRFQCLWRERLRVSAHGCFLRRWILHISTSAAEISIIF